MSTRENYYEDHDSMTAIDYYREADRLYGEGQFVQANAAASLASAAVALDMRPFGDNYKPLTVLNVNVSSDSDTKTIVENARRTIARVDPRIKASR